MRKAIRGPGVGTRDAKPPRSDRRALSLIDPMEGTFLKPAGWDLSGMAFPLSSVNWFGRKSRSSSEDSNLQIGGRGDREARVQIPGLRLKSEVQFV